mgnify:CR=1 FL=1
MSIHPFSPEGRLNALEQMSKETVDLLIVGGGITGCGLARDAALRGMKVALVEKEDFAYGTSSRSSKLVHGGIRYLANGEVNLVRESARERRVLQTIAPHLIHPIPFVFPLYKGNSTAKYRTGFAIFDKLAGVPPSDQHKLLKADEVRAMAPLLREPLKSGIVYGEYMTDDARFTLANAQSAAEHGAWVANHAAVTRFLLDGDRVIGAAVKDTISNKVYNVAAKVTVNATGPWAEETLLKSRFKPPKRMLLSKGVHLLFRAERIPIEGAIALRSPSGKEGFAIRRLEHVYVGTTDVPYDSSPDEPTADAEAVHELLTMAQQCFPDANITEHDIIGTWAGLRPLIDEGKSSRDTSRHDEVWKIKDGFLSIAGGKLTTYRQMAHRIMRHVAKELHIHFENNEKTAEVILPGGKLHTNVENFRSEMMETLKEKGVAEQTANRLTWLYGTFIHDLIRYGEEDSMWLEPLADDINAIKGEVRLAVEQEMALAISDFMGRRSALLLFSENHGLSAVKTAAGIMGALLGWDETKRRHEISRYTEIANAHMLPVKRTRS